MSLDCYPLSETRSIELHEQPMSIDVAYDDNLVICAINDCQSIVVYDLDASSPGEQIINKFKLGENIVVAQIVYSKRGDCIICVGHSNGSLSIYAAFHWRGGGRKISIEVLAESYDHLGPSKVIEEGTPRLNCIDVCQRTGNLAVSYGDLIQIYEYRPPENDNLVDVHRAFSEVEGDHETATGVSGFTDSLFSQDETVRDNISSSTEDLTNDLAELNIETSQICDGTKHFMHLITIKLSIWASSLSLVENYLSIMAVDHVQVLKLELLTVQLEGEATDPAEAEGPPSNTNAQTHSGLADIRQGVELQLSPNSVSRVIKKSNSGILSDMISNCAETTTTSSSTTSENSTSTRTNFSTFTFGTQLSDPNKEPGQQQGSNLLDNSGMSIITMNNNQSLSGPEEIIKEQKSWFTSISQYDCITWNLNTKKLVKLPTLMHNTSNSLSSYHVCHPQELLGPASESIACRVSATLYSKEFSRNQLEPVVMLCKQFDFDRDPVKSAHLQGLYLASNQVKVEIDHKARDGSSKGHSLVRDADANQDTINFAKLDQKLLDSNSCSNPLKSQHYEQLASINCFVATLTNCFIYTLHGKRVQRIQTIMHPDLCLDMRTDLLNAYILTPVGLQICSTGLCDSIFHYEWSSAADLNLNFIADCNKLRCLTTKGYAVFLASSGEPSQPAGQSKSDKTKGSTQDQPCQIEYMPKPQLDVLTRRIVHTINRCQSITIRSNLLTYLHANALIDLTSVPTDLDDKDAPLRDHGDKVRLLKDITVMLCKQLIQKKQTNVITNSRIDREIKHHLDSSQCDLGELMRRSFDAEELSEQKMALKRSMKLAATEGVKFDDLRGFSIDFSSDDGSQNSTNDAGDDTSSHKSSETGKDEDALDVDFELVRIYLKLSKFNAGILSFIRSTADDESAFKRTVSFMFDQNPRLLIKCAQRFIETRTMDGPLPKEQSLCLAILIDKLKQLAEQDSTGVNRATVNFTLAILYNARGEKDLCQATLSSIKPQNHLAITMCSNQEAISPSLARLINANYPEVYRSFLRQLRRRDEDVSVEFLRVAQETTSTEKGEKISLVAKCDTDCIGDQSEDEEDQLEQKIKLVSEIPPLELADILTSVANDGLSKEHSLAIEGLMKASINLLESQFILTRLCENTSGQ